MTSSQHQRRSRILGGVVLVVCVLGVVAHAYHLRCVAEDAFISFRFARHLAEGHGLVWNIGDPPVEGYTNFLWVVILAVAIQLGMAPGITAQLIGVAASAITLIFVYRLSRLVHAGEATHRHFLAVGLTAASGPVATWAASGMETGLFTLFVIMGFFYYLRDQRSNRLDIASALCLLFAGLTRPEGVLVFLVLGLHQVLRVVWGRAPEGDRRARLRAMLRWSLVFLLPGLLYFLWRFSYFGYLLPNTYYAKGAGSVDLAKRGLIYLALFGRIYLLPLALLVPLAGVVLISRRKEGSRAPLSAADKADGTESAQPGNDRQGSGWWLIPFAMFLIPYAIYVIAVGGDYMAMFRFIVPVIPLIYVIVQELFLRIAQASRSWWRPLEVGLIVVMFAYTLLPSLTLKQMESIGLPAWLVGQYRKPQYMHGYADGVAIERWHSARLTLIGKYFREFADSNDDSLVTNAIGAVSYYSGIRVYGEHGLVDTHIAHLKSAHLGQSLAGHEKGDYEYLLRKRPTFVMGTRQLFPRMASKAELLQGLPPYFRSYLQDYRVVNAPMIDRTNGEQGFFVFFALKGHGEFPTTSWFDPTD